MEDGQNNYIVFFAANKKKLEPVQKYLHRRGWGSSVFNNIKETLGAIVQRKPSFVFISWDIPGANVPKTEKIFSSTFNVICVAFSEKGDTKSLMQISTSGMKYSLLNAVSGPSVFAKITQVRRALAQEQARKEARFDEAASFEAAAQRKKDKKKRSEEDFFNAPLPPPNLDLGEVPKDGRWEEIPGGQEGKKRYRLMTTESEATGKSSGYFYEGSEPPVSNENGIWMVPPNAESKVTYMQTSAPVASTSEESSDFDYGEAKRARKLRRAGGVEAGSESGAEDYSNSDSDMESVEAEGLMDEGLLTEEEGYDYSAEKKKKKKKYGQSTGTDLDYSAPVEGAENEAGDFDTSDLEEVEAPSIHRKPKPDINFAEQKRLKKLEKSTLIELPKFGSFEDVGQIEGATKNTWIYVSQQEGSITYKGRKGVFYWEGEAPPKMLEDGSWTNEGIEGFLYFKDPSVSYATEFEDLGEQTLNTDQDRKPQSGGEASEEDPYAAPAGGSYSRKKKVPTYHADDVEDKSASYEKGEYNSDSDTITVRGRSLLADGVARSLKQLTSPNKDNEKIEIANTQRLGVMVVKSQRFSGYLLFAVGRNKTIDMDFLSTLKNSIMQVLKENGEELRDNEPLSIKTQEIDFKQWAEYASEFLVLAQHQDDEVGLIFLSAKRVEPDLKHANDDKMMGVNIEDIAPGTKLDFDITIHLPKNNKYFTYVKTGNYLTAEQKNRLINGKLSYFYVKEEDKSRVIAHYVLEMVNEHLNKKKAG